MSQTGQVPPALPCVSADRPCAAGKWLHCHFRLESRLSEQPGSPASKPDIRNHRRLAATLAADIAGCSRCGEIEDGTLAAMRAVCAEEFNPTVAAHRGRMFKTADWWNSPALSMPSPAPQRSRPRWSTATAWGLPLRGLPSASASILATSSATVMMCWAMASTWPPGWRLRHPRAAFWCQTCRPIGPVHLCRHIRGCELSPHVWRKRMCLSRWRSQRLHHQHSALGPRLCRHPGDFQGGQRGPDHGGG